jgi:hypothetical protein
MPVQVGSTIRFSTTVTDNAGVRVDPGALTIRYSCPPHKSYITLTYGTDAAVVRDGVGEYHCDIATPRDNKKAGEWRAVWQGTGANAGVGECGIMVQASRIQT